MNKKINYKIFSAVLIAVLLIILLPVVIVLILDTEFEGYAPFIQNDSPGNSIVFLSDTQDPIWVETLLLNENNNEEIKKSILNKIVGQNPRAIFHMGDLVALGFLNRDWIEVDQWKNVLNNRGISFYPAMGNHELMLFPDMGYSNFIERFPEFSRTGYFVQIDSMAVIILNSNFGEMSNAEIHMQNDWYESTLAKLENNESVTRIVVGCHHSPYTNSTIVSPSEEVQQYFVPAFLRSKKTKLFISGHAHAFEHFRMERKEFIVIGGGGGLQQPLLTGKEALWKDNFSSKESLRRFHFALLEKSGKNYIFHVQMIDTTYSRFQKIYSIGL
jgi:hypothetical protein